MIISKKKVEQFNSSFKTYPLPTRTTKSSVSNTVTPRVKTIFDMVETDMNENIHPDMTVLFFLLLFFLLLKKVRFEERTPHKIL